MSGQNPSNQTA